MSKHTPGPWQPDYHDDDTFEINSVEGSRWKAVATVTANHLGSAAVTRKESEANARLIAATPDLLAELRAIVEIYDNGATLDAGFDLPRIRAIIAKAAP